MKKFGDLLRDLRESRDLQQKTVANALHISNKLLSSYERNISYPPLDTLVAICEYYNVSADFLLQIEPKPITENIEHKEQPGYNIVALTPEQKRVLSYYERLDDENKEAVRGLMILLYKEQQNPLK